MAISNANDPLEREAIRSLCAVCEDAETLKSVCNADYVKLKALSVAPH